MSDERMGEVWKAALAELRLRMARETFQQWLQGSRVIESGEGALTIGIVSRQGTDWLEHRLRNVVERTVEDVAGRPIAVSFVSCFVDEDDGRAPPACRRPDPPAGATTQEAALCRTGEPPQRKRYPAGRAGKASRDEEEAHAHVPRDSVRGKGEEAETHMSRGTVSEGDAAPPEAAREEERPAAERGQAVLGCYIRLKTAFRQRALAELKGAPLSVFLSLALHLDADSMASPGIETIMRETGYSRRAVCSALAKLESLGLVTKRARYHAATGYAVNGYAWFGRRPAPVLWGETECTFRPRSSK